MGELNFDEVGYPESKEVLQAGTVLDIDVIRPKFEDFKQEAQRIATDSKALTVQDQDSLNVAVMLGGSAKKIAKAVDVQVKAAILEPNEYVKAVRGLGKAITDFLDEAERTTKQKISQYQARVLMEQRERQKKADEEARKLQEAVNKEAKEKGIEAPTVVAPIVQSAPKITRTESGSSYQVERWVCIIEKPEDVPREYCEPSQKLLNEAVKMGSRIISGCKIDKVNETRFRT